MISNLLYVLMVVSVGSAGILFGYVLKEVIEVVYELRIKYQLPTARNYKDAAYVTGRVPTRDEMALLDADEPEHELEPVETPQAISKEVDEFVID